MGEDRFIGSVTNRLKRRLPFLWRLYNHDHVILVQLPPSSHTLFHPWIRRFTMIISAWWLRKSRKFRGKKSKKQLKTRKWTTPKGCGFVQNIAPPSLSRYTRIKMEQTNKCPPADGHD